MKEKKKRKHTCRRAKAVQLGSLRKVTQHQTGADHVDEGAWRERERGRGERGTNMLTIIRPPSLSSAPLTPALPSP